MPEVNWDEVEDTAGGDYPPLPQGDYLARLDRIEIATTRSDNEMWKLTWVIEDYPYAGRLVWDNLLWGPPKALSRTKLCLKRLGVDTVGTMNVQPSMINGIQATLTLDIEEYIDREEKARKKNVVVYDGYNRMAGKIEEHNSKTEADPF